MANKFGVIYARYSSHNQKDVSIEQQVEACQKYAKAEDITIVEIYDDRAISGKSDKRPNFQRMLRDAEKGGFQYVIAWKSNRIGRNMLQAMSNECRLNDLGVRCLYTEEDFDDSAAGRFALRNMMNVNQFYIENLAEDVIRGMRDNAQKCLANSWQPLGFTRDKDLHIIIDEPKAAIAREIFERVATGETYASIARNLNERGIETALRKKWRPGSFTSMLSNEKYRGVYTFDDIRIEGGVPRIVDDELFYKVQERIKTKKMTSGRNTGDSDYLLTGKLFCGHCKSPMTGMSGHGRNKVFKYYKCKGNKKLGCKTKPISKELIEDLIANLLVNKILTDDTIKWIAIKTEEYQQKHGEGAEASILADQIKEVTNSINNILKAIEQGIFTASTKQRLIDLENEKQALEDKLQKAKNKAVPISRQEIIDTLTAFKTGDIRDDRFREDLFNIFIKAVYVYDDKLTLTFSFDDFNSLDVDYKAALDELSDDAASGSFNVKDGVPFLRETNTYFVNGVFIAIIKLP